MKANRTDPAFSTGGGRGRQSAHSSSNKRRSPRLPASTALNEQAPPYRVGQDSQDQREHPDPACPAHPADPASAFGRLRFIDLFCGCGGFTLGMMRAGFQCLAAIDVNPEAVRTLRENLCELRHPDFPPVSYALERDLTQFPPEELARLIGTERLDVIVGGPPCQGFSTARQVDGANHGARLKDDPRRHLYREFIRYVAFFKPIVFVMENVLGLRSAAGGEFFTRLQKEARALGYRVHSQIEDAWELGVPQKRRRQLIIGARDDLPGYFLPELTPPARAEPHTPLGAAIGDLPVVRAGGGDYQRDYDLARREEHLEQWDGSGRNYLFTVLEIQRAARLTNHDARPHSARDLGDFQKLREGENSAQAMRRGVRFDYPYDTTTFKDRYTRQSRWGSCSTIVAHLSKDGLMFIHPTQNRSLTPREAARVQSFPDWFRFPKARTQAYRLIGNAVPPIIGEAVGLAVKSFLRECARSSLPEEAHSETRKVECGMRNGEQSLLTAAATRRQDAACELERLAKLDRRALRRLPTEDFLHGWHALLFLFPGLHPDNARDHGGTEEPWPEGQLVFRGLEEGKRSRYARSGWPVALELIGREAWRRYKGNQVTSDEFYCAAAQRAGMKVLRHEGVPA